MADADTANVCAQIIHTHFGHLTSVSIASNRYYFSSDSDVLDRSIHPS
jgi:hypothetical protein